MPKMYCLIMWKYVFIVTHNLLQVSKMQHISLDVDKDSLINKMLFPQMKL